MVPYDLNYKTVKDYVEENDTIMYLPDSLKGLCIGMSQPETVASNLKSFCLPDETDVSFKGIYLSQGSLIRRRVKELQRVLNTKTPEEMKNFTISDDEELTEDEEKEVIEPLNPTIEYDKEQQK